MPYDMLFRLILALLTITLYVPRMVYKKRFPKTKIGAEIWVIIAVCLWTMSLTAYLSGLAWFDFRTPLPHWLRWTGIACMVLCLPLSMWTYRTLGVHFSTRLRLLEDHQLVSNGPYRFVRHPMYATLFLCALAASLTSANLLIMAASVIIAVTMALRIKREEAMLQDRFGERYREYMKKTGAIVPKLRIVR